MDRIARLRACLLRAARIGIVATAALVGSVTATAAAPPAAVTSAPVAGATVTSNCRGFLDRVVDGHLTGYGYGRDRFTTQGSTFPLSFDGIVETPRTMTLVRVFDGFGTSLAVRSDGSLWLVGSRVDGEALTTSMVKPTGWGGVRHITASRGGDRLYALTTSGGLYRYSIDRDLTLRGLGPIATSGWGSIRFLTDSHSTAAFDFVVGVSTAGSLRQYAINRSTGRITGGSIKPSGWDQISYIAVGRCETGSGVPMVGIHNRGGAFGYYDANASDFNGADIAGVGQIGHGFTGLISDSTSYWEGPPEG